MLFSLSFDVMSQTNEEYNLYCNDMFMHSAKYKESNIVVVSLGYCEDKVIRQKKNIEAICSRKLNKQTSTNPVQARCTLYNIML